MTALHLLQPSRCAVHEAETGHELSFEMLYQKVRTAFLNCLTGAVEGRLMEAFID